MVHHCNWADTLALTVRDVLALFTQLPRRGLPGNRVAALGSSQETLVIASDDTYGAVRS